MILQPTLVLLCGSGAEQLKEQVVRWISADERRAFYFAHINEAEEMQHTIPIAVHELRSAKLLSELIRGGYVPKNYRLQEFRTLIVCLSEDQDWIRTARRQLEVSLEATPFLNRIFWAVLLEQEQIENLQETQQKLFADFGGNESITLFHVLPFWRGSNLEPEDTSAILERLTVLLLKSDTEASLPMISEIAQNRSGWAIGIEAYRLKGHSEAGKCALFLAARELIAQCFTGQPLSAPTLANLVREKIPDFDSQADLDPFSPEGLDLVGRYVRDYVPELLDALASHSPDVESWLDCLKYLKREAAKPKRLGLLAPGGTTPDGKPKPAYSGLSVLLMTVSAAACYLLFKPAAEPAEQMPLALTGSAKTKQDLPHHPVFAAALERILADIQPLRYPELLQDALPAPEVETTIPTDSVETAKVDRTLIDAARDLLLQRTFALPSLLSFQFLTGEMAPASAMTKVLSAQQEMEKKLEGMLIDQWLTKVRETRRNNNPDGDSDWLEFMFASPIPNPVHVECEISDRQNQPQQPGWFPQNWLHYMHAVAIR